MVKTTDDTAKDFKNKTATALVTDPIPAGIAFLGWEWTA